MDIHQSREDRRLSCVYDASVHGQFCKTVHYSGDSALFDKQSHILLGSPTSAIDQCATEHCPHVVHLSSPQLTSRLSRLAANADIALRQRNPYFANVMVSRSANQEWVFCTPPLTARCAAVP